VFQKGDISTLMVNWGERKDIAKIEIFEGYYKKDNS
jgi:hypothetical protein